jgi:hypothetical protein
MGRGWRFSLLCLLVIASMALNADQTARPDLSGRWVMVSPAAGYQQVIKQDATSLTVTSYESPGPIEGQRPITVVYKFDGTDQRDAGFTKIAWDGPVLRAERSNQVLLWSLDGQGQLVLEVQNAGYDPRKQVYKRQQP